MDKLSVIFVGTGEFGVNTLNALASDPRVDIPFVVTGVDKEAGRNLKLKSSPVKAAAELNKLFIHQPKSIADLKQKITQAKPDLLLVVSYGEIMDESVLKIPKYGAINIHGSLLPRYRGASPIQESILNGDKKAGITWIVMDKHMDSGDIISRKELAISDEDTYKTLSDKLSQVSAKETANILVEYLKTGKKTPQEEKNATYCRKISREDGLIKVKEETADEIVRKIRAYTPWPGCYLMWNGKRLKIIMARVDNGEQKISSGITKKLNGDLLAIGTANGTLLPLRVQPESKREMSIEEFVRGQREMPTMLSS